MRLLALLLLPAVALADTWGVATVASYHLERGNGYCEVNPGAGVERGAALRAVAGVYRNSHCRTSWYAGASYAAIARGAWRAGGVVILVSGYDRRPILAPGALVAYERGRYGLNLILFPGKDGSLESAVVGLQAKWRFR